jgi:hypothetical protein
VQYLLEALNTCKDGDARFNFHAGPIVQNGNQNLNRWIIDCGELQDNEVTHRKCIAFKFKHLAIVGII